MTGQSGYYVYVVKPDMTVEARSVVLGRSLDNHTAVLTGLKVNENVVTDGQMRLYPGARVKVGTADNPGFVGRKPFMNVTELFIRRPVMTTLVMGAIVIFGLLGYQHPAGQQSAQC